MSPPHARKGSRVRTKNAPEIVRGNVMTCQEKCFTLAPACKKYLTAQGKEQLVRFTLFPTCTPQRANVFSQLLRCPPSLWALGQLHPHPRTYTYRAAKLYLQLSGIQAVEDSGSVSTDPGGSGNQAPFCSFFQSAEGANPKCCRRRAKEGDWGDGAGARMGVGCAFRRLVSELSRQAIYEMGFSTEPLRFGPQAALPEDAARP